jgi:uncharacterized membrane protein YqiK
MTIKDLVLLAIIVVVVAIVILFSPVLSYKKTCDPDFPNVSLDGIVSLDVMLGGGGFIYYYNYTINPISYKPNYELTYASANSLCAELVNSLCYNGNVAC